MPDDRRNIKVNPETFETLKADKPDGVTWDYYLSEMLSRNDTIHD